MKRFATHRRRPPSTQRSAGALVIAALFASISAARAQDVLPLETLKLPPGFTIDNPLASRSAT